MKHIAILTSLLFLSPFVRAADTVIFQPGGGNLDPTAFIPEGTRTLNLRIDSPDEPNDKPFTDKELALPKDTVYKDVRPDNIQQDNTITLPNDLAEIIESWPRLPEYVRQAIVTLVTSVTVSATETI